MYVACALMYYITKHVPMVLMSTASVSPAKFKFQRLSNKVSNTSCKQTMLISTESDYRYNFACHIKFQPGTFLSTMPMQCYNLALVMVNGGKTSMHFCDLF